MPEKRETIEDHQTLPTSPDPTPSSRETFTIPQGDPKKAAIFCERRGPASGRDGLPALIFTHGAGGDLSTPAMSEFAKGFSRKATIVSFKGNMNMTSRLSMFKTVIRHCADGMKDANRKVVIGGRSMGARTAALLAGDEDGEEGVDVGGLVLVNFPLKTEKAGSREEVLLGIGEGADVLFIAGTRDSMCSLDDLLRVIVKTGTRCWVVVVEGADHGMALKGSQSEGTRELRLRIGMIAEEWTRDRNEHLRFRRIEWSDTDDATVDTGWMKELGACSSIVESPAGSETTEERPAKRSRKSKG